LKIHCGSEEAVHFPAEELASALRSAERDDFSALFAMIINASPPASRERVASVLAPLRSKNTGKPKAKRNPDGTTEAQAATATGYTRFHECLAGGDASNIADAKAVNENPLFARVAKERRELIYRNGDSVINNITRANGTYQENARSLFLGF